MSITKINGSVSQSEICSATCDESLLFSSLETARKSLSKKVDQMSFVKLEPIDHMNPNINSVEPLEQFLWPPTSLTSQITPLIHHINNHYDNSKDQNSPNNCPRILDSQGSSFPQDKIQDYDGEPDSAYLLRLSNATICPPKAFVVFNNMYILRESLYLCPKPWHPRVLHEGSRQIMVCKTPSASIEKPVILLASNAATANYYHWHIDVLPAAFYLLEAINSGSFIVLVNHLTGWQRSSLIKLGIDNSKLLEVCEEDFFLRV
jgi:hypothetical protein